MGDSPFPRDKHLTAIAIAYRNLDTNLIADAIFPRMPVGKKLFTWTEYPADQAYSVPDTEVGEYSKVGSSRIKGEKRESSCVDQAWEIPLSRDDIDQAPPEFKPEDTATATATDIILLRRELRCARIAFNPAQYAAANKLDLSAGGGTDQWSDYDNSDPLALIRANLESCLVRPNVIAFGQQAWSKLSAHPKVVSAALGNSGTSGFAPRSRVAELLELNEVLVGEGWLNTAKPGKNPVMDRVWGPHALAFYRNRAASTQGGLTFGMTAEYEKRQAGSKEADIGARGGKVVRVFETVKEVVVAPGAAFLFQNAVA